MSKTMFGKKELMCVLGASALVLIACDLVLKRVFPPVHQAAIYGWGVPENSVDKKIIEDSPGYFRKIETRQFQHGFKRWGDPATRKVKMLIIGDSVTHMQSVSNGEEWYAFLERAFENLELFVYGGGGYGSLQEFMVLNDFIDEIRPQLILMQFSDNDYINNLYTLDAMEYPYNNHGVRPYLENGRIVYRLPLPFADIRKKFFVADRVLACYDRFVLNRAARDLDDYARKKNLRKAAMGPDAEEKVERLRGEAVDVTRRIYTMIRKRAGHIPVYLFNISDDPVVEEICRQNDFECISGINQALILKENEGRCVRIPNDGHWNALGNKIVGEKLVEYFRETKNAVLLSN